MAKRQHKRRSASGFSAAAVGGIALLCVAVLSLAGLGAFYYLAPRAPELDQNSYCPVAGPRGITVVLVDATDDLPEPAKRQATGILDDLITSLPDYYKLDIRVLDIPNSRSVSLFAKCNPGDGTGLSEWIANPRLARKRWIENFRKPAREAMEHSLAAAKANSSPIMAALQDIAISQFSNAAAVRADKSLIVISDMMEFTPMYSQYPRAGDLSYQRFKRSPAYLKLRTDLHDANVTIYYVQRSSLPANFDSRAHMEFWREWIEDNKGSTKKIVRLQGAN